MASRMMYLAVANKLPKFRQLFWERVLSDDLYLGYYLHLVQDLVYCRFVYEEHHWNPTLLGNVDGLHNDYALLNEMEYTWSRALAVQ